MKERLNWIDSTRGLLIMFVIIGYIPLGGISEPHVNGCIASFYDLYPLYGVMYMSAFFIITGYCSSFEKNI